MKPFVALLLAVMLAACTRAGGGAGDDAGVADAADDAAPAVDAVLTDAGPWGSAAAHVTRNLLERPVGPWACDPGPCGWVAGLPVLTVLRTRSVAGGVEVRGGLGASLSDGGVVAGYVDRLTPDTVLAEVGPPYETASGSRRPFATTEPVVWALDVVPGQPALPVRNATISGSLDSMDVPVSDDPEMGGTVEGCITQEDATQVYIVLLGMTLQEFIVNSGGWVDVDCTGSGSLDGYVFEATFEGEVVELQ